jgi:predicted MFS family arabinose efflux permease
LKTLDAPDSSAAGAAAAPLSQEQRARGRRLAIASHPAGMTFAMAFTQYLPTLALVSLGASETLVGLQSGLAFGSRLLQLPTLRAVARASKRAILLRGHIAALVASAPLLFFGYLGELGAGVALAIVFGSLVLTSAGVAVSEAVWFPLLRAYVEPERIGHFFGLIRSGWHFTLILFFGGCTLWLAEHEGVFGPLFAVAWALGVLRIVLIARLPERDERTGERIRIRQALALMREPLLRRYLIGVTWSAAVRHSVIPFAIVMLRREVGFSSAEVLYTTMAVFAGGLVSLYPWGRVVDRFGAEPVFRFSALGLAALYLTLLWVREPGALVLVAMIAFFFSYSVFNAGFALADTRLLFELTPPDAPARTLVLAGVVSSVFSGIAPILCGVVLDGLLSATSQPLPVYHGFFALAALAQALSFLPLRIFARPR